MHPGGQNKGTVLGHTSSLWQLEGSLGLLRMGEIKAAFRLYKIVPRHWPVVLLQGLGGTQRPSFSLYMQVMLYTHQGSTGWKHS